MSAENMLARPNDERAEIETLLKEHIESHASLKGKAKMVAIGALMRKLSHWCFGVLKSRRLFDVGYTNTMTVNGIG
nr:hypothetical protein [Dickeya dadantii]